MHRPPFETPLSPRERFKADTARADFVHDPAQAAAVAHTQRVYEELMAPPARPALWQRLRGRRPPPVKGLYLWGGVGRGKTYLMDCLYEALPFAARRRVHFHRFMGEVHQRLAALPRNPDPLVVVAREIASEVRVVCLDEFHVHDIGDAMLLGGLLAALFRHGVTLVTTSNAAPRDLYRNGLQRQRFLPAIALIEAHMEVVELGGEVDYREELLAAAGTYHVAGEEGNAVATRFAALARTAVTEHAALAVNGRRINTRALAADAAWFTFGELCETPRAASDYLELAATFPTVFLSGVPVLEPRLDAAAKRFIHLVDTFYDHGVKLVVWAAAPPAELYRGRHQRKEFERTASRLLEMASHTYLAAPHRPG
ncbi:MAG: cell division protein ZapE [Gammaproteobacteria bacterium]|nr:cell division protein ZapE [Gammaproteobacteria bacterium]